MNHRGPIVAAGERQVPGNKRRRPVLVHGPTGEDLLGGIAVRNAFLSKLPPLLVGSALARSSGFLPDVERAAGFELSIADLAGRYCSHPAMAKITGIAAAGYIEGGEAVARLRLLNLAGPPAAAVDGVVAPKDYKRWRGLGWREDAVEALISRGEGRCLLTGCGTGLASDGGARRRYCWTHRQHERTAGHAAAARHDRRLEAVTDLLDEVDEAMEAWSW